MGGVGLLLLLFLVPALAGEEEGGEGSGLEEVVIPDEGDEITRGDMAGDKEGAFSGDFQPEDFSDSWGDDCWGDGECSPDCEGCVNPDSTICSHCPQMNDPQTWRAKDFDLNLRCEPGLAVMDFSLSKLLDPAVPWLDDSWTLELSYNVGDERNNSVVIDDLEATSAELRGLCPGYDYSVCLQFTRKDGVTRPFCKVSLVIIGKQYFQGIQ